MFMILNYHLKYTTQYQWSNLNLKLENYKKIHVSRETKIKIKKLVE